MNLIKFLKLNDQIFKIFQIRVYVLYISKDFFYTTSSYQYVYTFSTSITVIQIHIFKIKVFQYFFLYSYTILNAFQIKLS